MNESTGAIPQFIANAGDVIFPFFNSIADFFEKIWKAVVFGFNIAFSFVVELPFPYNILVYIIFFTAAFGAILAYIKSFYKFNVCNAREFYRLDIAKEERQLQGYFFGPAIHQIANVYRETKSILNGKQYWFGIYFLQKKVGDWQPDYKILLILLTPIFLLLWVMSIPEVAIRYIFGRILLFGMTLLHFVTVIVLKPIFSVISKILKIQQNQYKKIKKMTFVCPNCKRTCEEPYYQCPECGNIHKELSPGRLGFISSRCGYEGDTFPFKCQKKYGFFGKKIPIPYSGEHICDAKLPLYMGSKYKLKKICPYCGDILETGSTQNYGIQLVGASNSGKTAFLTAFWHLYLQKLKNTKGVTVKLTPNEKFEELQRNYTSGISYATTEKNAISYSVEHFFEDTDTTVNFSIYDIAGETFENEDYEKIQEQFSFCNGIIIVIDPLNSSVVRKEYENEYCDDLLNYSDTTPDSVITSFIDEFKKQRRIRADKTVDLPVSVVITKTDTRAVKKEIGKVKIRVRFKKEAEKYKSQNEARDSICREYLQKIDMGDVVNILDLNFSNVHYFPVSAIGHNSNEGEYEPYGIIESVEGLLQGKLLKIVKG